jgi:hypothetical protein
MSKKFVCSTKLGSDGRPVKESYQSSSHGVYTGGRQPEIVERKQTYQHTGTGLEKAGLERMYQGKGRKMVYENNRASGVKNSYNYFKGMREEEAPIFDKEWESGSQRLGLNSMKSLPYGSGSVKQYHKGYSNPSYDSYEPYMDENRRGYYISDRQKGENMPIRPHRPQNLDRIMPTDTSHRLDVPNNRNSEPLALPSNENRGQANRAQARNTYAPVNSRAPISKKPARIS